jgi:hypothetical protein
MCSGRVGSSCSTSGTRRVNLVTNPVISREEHCFMCYCGTDLSVPTREVVWLAQSAIKDGVNK